MINRKNNQLRKFNEPSKEPEKQPKIISEDEINSDDESTLSSANALNVLQAPKLFDQFFQNNDKICEIVDTIEYLEKELERLKSNREEIIEKLHSKGLSPTKVLVQKPQIEGMINAIGALNRM